MALKKVRGFNRGKTYDDLRQIAGGTLSVPLGSSGIAGIYTFLGSGTPWSNTLGVGGSVQRGYGYADPNSYPASSNNNNGQYTIYLEDLGSLADFYAAGGFCVSMKVKYQNQAWQALGSDGTNFICANTAASSSTTPDLLNYQTVPNTVVGVNVGYSAGRVTFQNNLIVAASGSQYITAGTAPGGTWTTLTSAAAQGNMSFMGSVFRNGRYHMYGFNNSQGGAVLRTADANWTSNSLNTGTMVYNAGGTINAIEYMDWFDDVGCFLGACTRNRANAAAQAGIVKSVDGVTWTEAYSTGATTTGLLSVATNGTGTAVAVGYNGYVVVSTDGTATTWTPVNGGQNTERFTSVRWFKGEFVAMGISGGTSTSPDGLTWTWTPAPQNLNFGGGIGMEQFIHKGDLYCYYRGQASQMITMKYLGSRQWQIITAIYTGRTNSASNPSIPSGIFFGDPISASTGFIINGNNMAGLHMTGSGAYVVQASGSGMWAFGSQVSTAEDYNWHRISVVGTSIIGQAVPTFAFSIYYDGNLVAGPSAARAATSGTQKLYICSSASSWNFMADIVVTDFSGTRNIGLTNDMQIRPRQLTTDVQAQWEKVPAGASSNATAAQGNGSVLYASSFVQSSGTTDTDVYAGGTQAPVNGYKIAAMNVTATFQRLGIPTPTVELSVTESGSSLPAQSTTLSGTTTQNVTLNALYPTKLDGTSWTPQTVTTANVQIKRTA